MNERFDELWREYLEGDLVSPGLEELHQLLTEHPDLLSLAADFYEEHRLLGVINGRFDVDAFLHDVKNSVRQDEEDFVDRVTSAVITLPEAPRALVTETPFRWLGYAAAIACTLLLSLAAQYFWLRSDSVPIDDPRSPSAHAPTDGASVGVASLIVTDSVRWDSKLRKNDKAQLLPQTLSLGSGTAVLRFDCGALAILEGKCKLVIESGSFVKLIQGQVTIHAPEEAYGFTVVTPASEIIDLGTEFHVAVADNGETAVQVLEGEIQAESRQGKNPTAEVLTAGDAVLFGPDGRRVALVGQVRAKRFLQRYSEIRSAAQRLMASESFAYTPGKHLLPILNGGEGWSGPWRGRRDEEMRHFPNDEGKTLLIERKADAFAGFTGESGEKTAAVRFPPGSAVRLRQMRQSINLSKNGPWYVSFLLRRDHRGVRQKSAPHGVFRLTLRSSRNYWGDTVGISFPSGGRPILQLGPKNRYSSPARFMRRVPLFCVLKVDAKAEGEDRAFVRIYEPDETVNLVEPSLWTMTSKAFRSRAGLDLVVVTASGPLVQWFDELRIGKTWESVTAGYGDHHRTNLNKGKERE